MFEYISAIVFVFSLVLPFLTRNRSWVLAVAFFGNLLGAGLPIWTFMLMAGVFHQFVAIPRGGSAFALIFILPILSTLVAETVLYHRSSRGKPGNRREKGH
jgi:hypothetical protein